MSIRKRVRAGRLIIDARSLCIFTYSSLVLGNLFTAQISGYLNNRNQSCQTIARLFISQFTCVTTISRRSFPSPALTSSTRHAWQVDLTLMVLYWGVSFHFLVEYFNTSGILLYFATLCVPVNFIPERLCGSLGRFTPFLKALLIRAISRRFERTY